MHVTFRRSDSYSSLSPKSKQITSLIRTLSKKHHIQLYDLSINSNHIHLLVRGKYLKGFQNFLREVSTKIVRLITETKKGKELTASFWASRPWSRIVEWGRAFNTARAYLLRNRLETSGVIPYDRAIKMRDLAFFV